MHICAVVVWYNPEADFVENVRSYASRMGRVYVIDNSAADNAVLLSDVPNAVYVPNGGNRGIAVALNQGCALALADGFEWAMTMDQDSHWNDDMLGEYLRLCEEHAAGRTVSFAPGRKDASVSRRSFLQRVYHALKKNPALRHIFKKGPPAPAVPESNAISVNKVITSGNVISLAVWQEVGRFFEPFFIDEVDHGFCFRLREHGYEIVKFPAAKMEHHLGNPPKKAFFFPPVTYHSKVRLFYIYRNCAYQKKLHPAYFKKCGYARELRHRRLEVILNLRFGDLKYLGRGGYCARHERLGQYEDWYKN